MTLWTNSTEYKMAMVEWINYSDLSSDKEDGVFETSRWFRNARSEYRKRMNGRKES